MLYTKCNSYNPYVSLLVGRSACRHNFLKGREVQTRIQRCAIMAFSSVFLRPAFLLSFAPKLQIAKQTWFQAAYIS